MRQPVLILLLSFAALAAYLLVQPGVKLGSTIARSSGGGQNLQNSLDKPELRRARLREQQDDSSAEPNFMDEVLQNRKDDAPLLHDAASGGADAAVEIDSPAAAARISESDRLSGGILSLAPDDLSSGESSGSSILDDYRRRQSVGFAPGKW